MKQLIKGKIIFALILSAVTGSVYTMEMGKNTVPAVLPAEKISVEAILSSTKEATVPHEAKINEIESIDKAVQEFDKQFGKSSQEILTEQFIKKQPVEDLVDGFINTNKQNLAQQFIKKQSVEDLIEEFINKYDQNPEVINNFVTDEMNVIVDKAAANFVEQIKSDDDVKKITALFFNYIELVIEQTSMPKTGLMLIATELAIAKAINKIISVSLSDKKMAKSIQKLVNKVAVNVISTTISNYCTDKDKAKRLKAIIKKILNPKKKAVVNGENVAKIVISKVAKL